MNYDELKQIWAQKYDTVPQQLEKLKTNYLPLPPLLIPTLTPYLKLPANR